MSGSKYLTRLSLVTLALGVACATPAGAEDIIEAIKNGTPILDVRYRYETVSQTGIARRANANTVRTRFGYKTAEYARAYILVDFENITSIGNTNFNNTINGRGQFPVIADPSSTEVNQAYLNFSLSDTTTIRGGRQVVTFDNHRWIGDVGFRQNQQTFDAVTLVNTSLPETTAVYGWVGNVNRIFGDNSPVGDLRTNTHLLNVSNKSLPIGTITGYAYLIDINRVAGLSTKTFGLRLVGSQELGGKGLKLLYTGEYARQSDHANNPASFGVNYYLIEGGAGYKGLTAKVGFEELGSNGVNALSTPLATLHAHNGWADVFLGTPATGLQDFYVSLKYQVKGVKGLEGLTFQGIYHDFSAAFGGGNYGTEWDFRVAKTVYKHVMLALKYANYNAKGFATDRNKFWLTVNFKL